MKKVTVLILAILVLASLSIAGEPKDKAGDRAWLFQFQGLSNLGVGNYGGGVGAQYYFQDGMAFRGALGFNWWNRTTKVPTGGSGSDRKESNVSFSLMPAILYNISSNGPVVSYVGGQVGFTWSSATDENPGFVSGDKNTVTTTDFGIGGLAGFEWFAWDNISLSAEYDLMLDLSSGSHENTSGGATVKTDDPSVTTLGLNSSGWLTLGVYF